MKRQQRAFVVEVKQPRRRTAAAKQSIWSGTDLKSFAREVEADAANLSAAAVPSSTAVPCHSEKADERRDTYLDSSAIPAGVEARVDVEVAAIVPAGIPTAVEESVSDAEPRIRRPQARRAKEQGKRRKSTHRKFEGLVERAGSDDVLLELEKENSRLRQLLRQRMIEENAELRARLARFAEQGQPIRTEAIDSMKIHDGARFRRPLIGDQSTLALDGQAWVSRLD